MGRNEITGGTVSPSYILPIQGLQRLQKIMDEYCGGLTNNYMTNDNLLKKRLRAATITSRRLRSRRSRRLSPIDESMGT